MSDNVNIIVQDTINEIVVNTAVVVETIDINVQVAVDEVNIIANPNNYVVNINRIIGEQVQSDWDQNDDQEPDYIKNKPSIPTLTSDLTNDGEDGINPFITANDVTPQVNSDWNATSGVEEILNKPTIPTLTSDLINDGDDGVNPFITAQDIPTFATADRMVTVGRNSTGSTLYRGTIVYILGSTGNRPNFVKSIASSEGTSAGTFGVIENDIPNNSDGNCVTIGTIENLDTRSNATHPFTTNTLVDGDTIYLSPTNAGFITNVKPSAPDHLVYIGKVVRTSPTNGTIVYRIQNGYELQELHNVAINGVSNNQLLAYESSTSLWKNKSVTTAEIADSLNKRYVTDANLTTIGNQSGVNTGDQDLSGLTPNTRSISTTTPLQGGGDLSANRTLSILQSNTTQSGFLSNTDWNTFNGKFNLPSLTSGSVLFSNGTTIAQDNANLFWDDTNNRLGIGTSAPLIKLHVVGTGESEVRVSENTNNNYITLYQQALTSYLIAGRTGATSIQPLAIYTGGSEKMRIQADGNIGINTTAPTAKLAIKAGGALSTDIALRVRNSADTADLFQVQGNGAIVMSTGAPFYTVGNNLNFRSNLGGGSGFVLDAQSFNSLNSTNTEQGFGFFSGTFAPTSGTGTLNGLKITPTINQTGGANGITRGLYINPTLTAAANFRAIETTVGNVILGSTSGNVGIGTAAPTSKLQVVGLVDYATNALAIAGGLTVGAFYHTAGVVKVVI